MLIKTYEKRAEFYFFTQSIILLIKIIQIENQRPIFLNHIRNKVKFID